MTTTTDTAIIRNHLAAICRLESATFDPPWKEIDFVNECDSCDSCGMLLLQDDKLAGYLFSKIVLDDIMLNKICIDAALRGQGYGKLLLGNFLAAMQRNYRSMFLEVDVTNVPAIRLYTSFGFHPIRTRKAIYANGADGIEMVLAGKR